MNHTKRSSQPPFTEVECKCLLGYDHYEDGNPKEHDAADPDARGVGNHVCCTGACGEESGEFVYTYGLRNEQGQEGVGALDVSYDGVGERYSYVWFEPGKRGEAMVTLCIQVGLTRKQQFDRDNADVGELDG